VGKPGDFLKNNGKTLVTLVIFLAVLYVISRSNYLLFHGIVEIFSIAIAFSVFMFTWNSRRFLENNFFVIIGISFLFVGAIDFLHTLAYRGMGVFPATGANLATELWIGARYFESVSFVLALMLINRTVKANFVFTAFTLAFGMLLLSIFYRDIFPDCFIEGQGLTVFKIASEYVIAAILIAAILLLRKQRKYFDAGIAALICWGLVFKVFAELAFTLYTDVSGIANVVGHFLKFCSFFLIYKAVIETGLEKPYSILFRELKHRNEFIQAIVDNMPVGLAVNTIDDGKAQYMNRRFEEIYGWPREAFASVDKFFELVYPGNEPLKKQVMEDIASGDESRMRWERFVATGRDGRKRVINAQNIPLTRQNLMVSLVWDVTDVAKAEEDKKKLEIQLVQAQKMEAVGRLAGGVAHDFNNLLTVILGYSQILLEKETDDETRGEIQEIYQSGERAASLTRQLLAFSRKQPFFPQLVDINQIVANVSKMLKRLIGEDINLVIKLVPGLPKITLDPHQIDQVLINLAVNAKDAMPAGGTLTFETGAVEIDEEYALFNPEARPGRFIRLTVEDTGQGMDQETKQRLFEPFFTTKREGKGTGLGLSVIYGIIKQSQGWINIYSEIGQGTVFKIYLPVESEEPVSRQAGTQVKRGHPKQATILVVEDEEGVRKLARNILENEGHKVYEAASLAQAEAEFASHRSEIEMVFTDIVLSDGNGLDLVSKLLALKPGLAVLTSSGYANHKSQIEVIKQQNYHFINKPYSGNELLAAVAEALEKEPGSRNLISQGRAGYRRRCNNRHGLICLPGLPALLIDQYLGPGGSPFLFSVRERAFFVFHEEAFRWSCHGPAFGYEAFGYTGCGITQYLNYQLQKPSLPFTGHAGVERCHFHTLEAVCRNTIQEGFYRRQRPPALCG